MERIEHIIKHSLFAFLTGICLDTKKGKENEILFNNFLPPHLKFLIFELNLFFIALQYTKKYFKDHLGFKWPKSTTPPRQSWKLIVLVLCYH